MNREIREHIKRVLPEIAAGGTAVSLGQAQSIIAGARHLVTAQVEGITRAHAEVRVNAMAPHRWTVSCAVERDWQGRGLGRQVLAEALAYCDANGAEYVDGVAWASNLRVLKLDRSLGFEAVGHVRDAYRRDGISYDQVILVRSRP